MMINQHYVHRQGWDGPLVCTNGCGAEWKYFADADADDTACNYAWRTSPFSPLLDGAPIVWDGTAASEYGVAA